jgi:uncharacterized protein YsxB (DUF464 family)
MIKVHVVRNENNITSIKVTGHAGYAEHGQDIVCAAVSALVETAVLGIENIACIRPMVIKKEGFFSIKLSEDIEQERMEKAMVILETMILGFKDISNSYPSYIRIEEIKEVP